MADYKEGTVAEQSIHPSSTPLFDPPTAAAGQPYEKMAHGHNSPPKTTEQQRLAQRRAQLLPWIESPLTHFFHTNAGEHHSHRATGEEAGVSSSKAEHDATVAEKKDDVLYEEIEAEEATSGELFYDLFFVANLTTITSVHYMTDYNTLVSYILFFTILWFSWLQTTLYDIRFSVDSVYERVMKAIHFFVMMGFASVSTNWNPMDTTLPSTAANLQFMAIVLMTSRLGLGIQYGVTAFYARRENKGVLPLILHCAAMFVAGFVYLGLYFVFRSGSQPRSYIVMFIVILLEAVAVLVTSALYVDISFKMTHLVERMGLLTLIVMGEGIIVMLKAVNVVEQGSTYGRGWSASIFFIVAAAVMVIYMLYMFYFDYTPRNVHYGRYRQEFWAVLHFPYHLCIVLAVEGLRQWTTYWSYLQAKQVMDNEFLRIPVGTQDAIKAATIDIIRKYVDYLYKSEASTTILKTAQTIDSVLESLETLPYESWTPTNMSNFDVVYRDMYRGYAEFYGIKVPKSSEADPTYLDPLAAGYDPGKEIATVYRFVFTYYFLGFGCIFFMLGAFGLFVRRKKDVWDYIAVALRFLVGTTFCAMQAMKASTNSAIYDRFVASPWPIPAVCIVMFATLCLDKIIGLFAYRRMKFVMGQNAV